MTVNAHLGTGEITVMTTWMNVNQTLVSRATALICSIDTPVLVALDTMDQTVKINPAHDPISDGSLYFVTGVFLSTGGTPAPFRGVLLKGKIEVPPKQHRG